MPDDVASGVLEAAASLPGAVAAGTRPENQLLVALARLRIAPAEREALRSFMAEFDDDLDFGYFLDQAGRHRVLPLVARNLVDRDLIFSEQRQALMPYPWLYWCIYAGNHQRNTQMAHELSQVVRALHQSGVRYAIRKGPILGEGVYGDIGARRMNDLDVLLSREDLPQLDALLQEQGYRQGRPSANGRAVVPFTRATQMYWRVNLSNALPYIKVSTQAEIDVFEIDVAYSVFQPRSNVNFSTDAALRRVVPQQVFGQPSYTLDPVDQIIDLCADLHKEATTLHYIHMGRAFMIGKLLDLHATLSQSDGDTIRAIPGRAAEYRAEEIVYYALHFATELYGVDVFGDLLTSLRPADLGYLDEYGRQDGKPGRWDASFLERVFDSRQKNNVKDVSTIPEF